MRKVRVLINPKSGMMNNFGSLRRALDEFWEVDDVDLSYQFMQSKDDGIAKAQRCVDEAIDTVLVCGGDGTISTVGRVLVNSSVRLGVLPAGSGNGFARHFGIALTAGKAAEQLAAGTTRSIDVGVVNGTPFFVTCSMAWDAAIVRSFEKSPIRGIVPYVFAGVQEFFGYERQNMTVALDDGEAIAFDEPLIMTVANLTQYGGGAIIAPGAKADDGQLEFVCALYRDMPWILANLGRLFDGSLQDSGRLVSRSARSIKVKREKPGPIQVDGELMDAGADIDVSVIASGLKVVVPSKKSVEAS